MIASVLRSGGAVVAGLAVAFVLVIAVEAYSSVAHPLPEGLDATDLDVCKAHVAAYPPAVLATAMVGWWLLTSAAAWTATRLGTGRHRGHGVAVGLILLALAVFNMSMLPYPGWFWAGNLVGLPLGAYLGAMLGGPRDATAAGVAIDGR